MIAWHYTVGTKIRGILYSGKLDPSKTVSLPNEKPLLWFSTNQEWEETACKAAVTLSGSIVRLNREETEFHCQGLYRFGITACKLVEWRKAATEAGMTRAQQVALWESGIEQGANPDDWMAINLPIDINDCLIQRYHCGQWEVV